MTAALEPETFLQKQLRLKREREATTTAQSAPIPRNVVDLDNPRAQRWLEVKLQAQLDDLAAMPPDSGRNDKLNAIAYSFGHYIPKWLDENSVRQRLTDAAHTAGLSPIETRATIDSGLASGMDEPRDPPVSTSPDTLADLVAGTVIQRLAPVLTAGQDTPPPDTQDPLGSWQPIDLSSYLDGSYTPPQPCHLARADQVMLIYPSRVHWLSGEPEALKSWLGMLTCSQALLRGERVVYLDLEDGAAGVTARLLAMGVPADLLNTQFIYLAPHEPLSWTRKQHLEPILDGASLLVIDACTESLALQQLSPKDDVDIAAWLALLPRWAARQGLTVLVLDHVTKDAETRGRWATGSQHKLAGLDGVAFTLEAVTPGGKGMRGRSRLFISKDRHGEVRPHSQRVKGGKDWVGDLIVDSSAGGFTEVVLEPPSNAEVTGEPAPTDLAGHISRVLVKLGRAMSTREIRDRVKGKSADIATALAWLVDEGYVAVEIGPRGAHLHSLNNPYPSVEEDTK